MRLSPRLAAVVVATLALLAPARAQDAFFAGKRLTVLVNYAAGGPTDAEARLFAKHLARHLGGAPGAIVQNMDGAGGLVGVNYLGEVAPRDGTTLGYLSGAAWQSASESRPRRVDFRSFEFLAYQPGTSIYFVRADTPPGIRTPRDILAATGVISGGVGVDNAKDILLRLTMEILGVPSRHVTGYKGSQGARLAMQQGEINYYSEGPAAWRSVVEPALIATGEAIPLFHDPAWDGSAFGVARQMDGLDIPHFHEFYRKLRGGEPSGDLWRAYLTVIALSGAMQRLIVLPPGAPKAAADALRKVIVETGADRAFQEDCVAQGFAPDYVADDSVNERVRGALAVSPEMKSFIRDYAASKAPAGVSK